MNKARLFVLTILITGACQQAQAADGVEKSGDILQILIPAVAFSSTLYLDNKAGQKQFYKSFATNFLITHGLKNIVDKKRPSGSSQSFPSGHTSAAFQGAAFIHKLYGIKVAIPAYIGATFVGYSRVASDKHFTEDVIAGALIGIASSFYFATEYKGLNVSPVATSDSLGITIAKRW